MIAVLFYRSAFGLLVFPAVFYLADNILSEIKTERRNKQFMKEFGQFLELLEASLQAGFSMENSVFEAEKDMRTLFGNNSQMVGILTRISERMRLQVPLEQLFLEMAEQENFEEVMDFARMFSFSKRMGGDYTKRIEQSATKIGEKIRVRQEIDTIIAAKKLELIIMCIMPVCLLAFINISSPEFLEGLYGNAGGAIMMSLCLVLYGFFIFLGRRIVDIEV